MKNKKSVKPFFFNNMSHKQAADLLNKENQIKLKYNEDLINRIWARYPLLKKSEIGIIVMAVIESMRELLVMGNVLNFNNLFFDTKFLFFRHTKNGVILPALKVKISTPPPLRNLN